MNVSTTATSVHPGFRTALMTLSMAASWSGDGSRDDEFAKYMVDVYKTLRTFGDGSYPNESTGDNPNWKTDFWDSNYDRLAQIKKTWDPDNVFMCEKCVSWDNYQN